MQTAQIMHSPPGVISSAQQGVGWSSAFGCVNGRQLGRRPRQPAVTLSLLQEEQGIEEAQEQEEGSKAINVRRSLVPIDSRKGSGDERVHVDVERHG